MAANILHPSTMVVFALAIGVLNLTLVAGNKMDPHVFPQNGPFFEGWYTRIIDSSQNSSFGFLFGLILPTDNTGGSDADESYLCVSILASPQDAAHLDSPTGCFPTSDYSALKNGKPVTRNPDDISPPDFEVKIGQNVSFVVTANSTEFSVSIGDHKLEGKTTSPVAWGPKGEGPEGWMRDLPFPIHWFVYSLRSTVTEYSYTNSATGQAMTGGSSSVGAPEVVAHLEKNWGNSFNEAWVWAEGVDPATNVSFAVASGELRVLFVDVPAQLSGYRNPDKGIDCSFHPTKSVHTLTHDGCAGTATLDVRGLGCHVIFELSADPASFGACLVTPQVEGFKLGAIESYTATANITAYVNGVTDNQVIKLSALEFGGKFMCDGKCP